MHEQYATEIADNAQEPAPPLPAYASCSTEDLLERLPHIAAARQTVDGYLQDWVTEARARHISWARIGEALGMTRQSAWERFKTD